MVLQVALVLSSERVDPNDAIALAILAIMLGGFIIWISLATYTKRWHDLDKSGWMNLTLIIPLINLFIVLFLGFARGRQAMTLLEAVEQAIRSGAKEVKSSITSWAAEDFKDIAKDYMSTYPDRREGWTYQEKPVKPESVGRLIRYEPGQTDMFWSFDVY